jgi:hypothetical protein
MVSAAAHSKMTIVTLSQLVKKSEIIVYGHFNPLARGASSQSPAIVRFEAESILKGKGAVAVGTIPLCNLRDEYSDEYDLAKLTGVDILFVSKKGSLMSFRMEIGLLCTVDAIRDRLEHSALTITITGPTYRGVKARKLASKKKDA